MGQFQVGVGIYEAGNNGAARIIDDRGGVPALDFVERSSGDDTTVFHDERPTRHRRRMGRDQPRSRIDN